MRLYLVVNRYSMGIQAGIQALHVIPELYEKYSKRCKARQMLDEWAQSHKTVIVLRSFGGNDSIEDVQAEVAPIAARNALPYAVFREAELKDSATAFGIVVPTAYYDPEPHLRNLHAVLDKFPFAI